MTVLAEAAVSPDAPATTGGLLRLATAGSVDDGKSTLVGRLLFDSKSVLIDQYEAVERASRDRGLQQADLALLTDGLRSEREQGITIDVAYRYFATPRRRFILADTPGHVQYTRNMATGASTAHLAVILVDAVHGVAEQTRRHAAIASLLRVEHLVLAVNKMDLVGFDADRFAEIAAAVPGTVAIPVSALLGDNVVEPSARMPWYRGPTLLGHLETVPLDAGSDTVGARMPVQYVIRAGGDRRYAGRLAAGRLAVGDEVVVLTSGRRSTVTGIDVLGVAADAATAGTSLALTLADDLDVGRGDLIATAADAPTPTRDLTATVCQVADRDLRPGDRILVKHGTRTVRARVTQLLERWDIDTGTRIPAPDRLASNDIGTVRVRTADPLPVDGYEVSRATGSLLLIDEEDGTTVAAGMAEVAEGPSAR